MNRPWFEKYIGLPFVDHGRDWCGVDCWGLVRLVLWVECRIQVPSYGDISAEDLTKVAKEIGGESGREPWLPVIYVNPFDVAVMHRRRSPVHVGIMIDDKMILHIERATLAVQVPIKHPSVMFRSISYFRHRELLNVAA